MTAINCGHFQSQVMCDFQGLTVLQNIQKLKISQIHVIKIVL